MNFVRLIVSFENFSVVERLLFRLRSRKCWQNACFECQHFTMKRKRTNFQSHKIKIKPTTKEMSTPISLTPKNVLSFDTSFIEVKFKLVRKRLESRILHIE